MFGGVKLNDSLDIIISGEIAPFCYTKPPFLIGTNTCSGTINIPETDQPENWAHRGGPTLSAAASGVDVSGFLAFFFNCYYLY